MIPNVGSLVGTPYRTSVMYDFSIVEKAVFYILERVKNPVVSYVDVGSGEKSPFCYNVIEKLPVQINPSSIDGHEGGSKVKSYRDVSNKKKNKYKTFSDDDDDSITVNLRFSVYDEYNLRTMNGMLAAGGTALGGNITLKNPKVTILPKLLEYSKKFKDEGNKLRVLLQWGDNKFFGLLGHVGYSYKTYSCWGEPLDGEASVTIELEDYDDSEMSPAFGKIKTYQTASRILNTAALAASQALR